jgi:hypothetical protein
VVIALIAIASWIIAVVLLVCILGEIQRSKRELEETKAEIEAFFLMDESGPGPYERQPPPEAPRRWLN